MSRLHQIPQQHGALLLITMALLVILMMVGLTLTDLALFSEQLVRNKHDRMIAHQTAQAALADAELDIEQSATQHSRSALFAAHSPQGFIAGCSAGTHNIYQGLCHRSPPDQKPVWQTVDLSDDSSHAVSVEYGRFTDHRMQTGNGPFPKRLPRYLIECMTDHHDQAPPNQKDHRLYRITAIGFGTDLRTRAVVQSVYRSKGETSASRLSWRELPHWQDVNSHP